MKRQRSQQWTRDELILALELYKRLDGRIPDERDPEIIALSALMAELAMLGDENDARAGRSRVAIIYKMGNFRFLDPQAKGNGKLGFSNVSTLDRSLWKEFANDNEKLARAARAIRKRIRSGQAEIEPIRANLHILRLLGDELIGSHRLAVFELVKNAYDADAENVTVRLELENEPQTIVVQDDGYGMSLDIIRNGWLQIGTPLKRGDSLKRTELFHRIPLGEKGVGRLAAFKLGDRLEMITRQAGGAEYNLTIDLERIMASGDRNQNSSVEDVRVRVRTANVPLVFKGDDSHGTVIRISKLRSELVWSKHELRELQRLVNSLTSPFEEIGEFRTQLLVPGRQEEIDDLPDISRVLGHAVYVFSFELDATGRFKWTYNFCPPPVFRGLNPRELKSAGNPNSERLELMPPEPEPDMPVRSGRDKLFASEQDLFGIGPIKGRFYVFDLRREVLKHLGLKAVRMILENQGGVRVYRDAIRVFNYGEPGDDWLELNIKRVNKPGKKLATNSLVAAIHLSLGKSKGLKEKTNREGFDANDTYSRFKRITESIVEYLNIIRQPDRDSLDRILKGDPLREDGPVRLNKAVEEILDIANKKGILEQISKPVERLRKEYETLQEVVVSSGAGLNLAIVFHEVEREARRIADGLKQGENPERLKVRAEALVTILDGFGNLLKKTERKTMPVSVLISRAVQLSKGRFNAHKITCSCPVLTGEEKDFKISGAMNFYLTTLLNLIENSIYWVRRRSELEGGNVRKALQIRLLPDWAGEGPSLAVIDNGPGFSISPEDAMRPFASTRPGGMGLGLYFASTAMEANGGELLIPQSIDDLDIDTKLGGAAVVMRFRRVR